MIVQLDLEPAPDGETVEESEDLKASADAIVSIYGLLDASARAWW